MCKHKLLPTMILTGILIMCSSVPSLSTSTGWQYDGAGWSYVHTDGHTAKQIWLDIGGKTYAFDDEGHMLTGWWHLDNQWYLFDESGAMYHGWYQDKDGNWYWFDEKGVLATDTWIGNCYVNKVGVWVPEAAMSELTLEEKLTMAFVQLRAQYPEGAYWNHAGYIPGLVQCSDILTMVPCDHEGQVSEPCNYYVSNGVCGYQCDGFARKISDTLFGVLAPYREYEYSFDAVQVGDYLRYSDTIDNFHTDGHSVTIIGKTASGLITLESNYGGTCKIHWDGILTKNFLEQKYVKCFSRR